MIKHLPFVVLALAFAASLRLIVASPASFDSWTHMGVGRFVVEERRVPAHTDISFKSTEPSLEWISHSWMADLFIYLAGSNNLAVGTVLLSFPLLALSAYLLWQILLILKISQFTAQACLVLSVVLSNVFWRLHPLIFAPPLALAAMYFYLKWRQGNSKIIWLWPAIFLLWANLVGGFIFVLGFLCFGILFFEFIQIFIKYGEEEGRHRPSFATLILVLFLSVLASVINPNMFRIWFYVLTFFGVIVNKQWLSTLPGLLLLVNQSFIKQSPSTLLHTVFALYSIFGLLALFTFVVVRRFRFVASVIYLLPLVFFILLGFVWLRFIPLAVFVSMPVVAILMDMIIKSIKGNKRTYIEKGSVVLAVVFIIFIFVNPPKIISFELPNRQVELIREFDLSDNILTTPDLTGYVFYSLYPKKVLLDAQDDLFDENETLGIFYLPGRVDQESLDRIVIKNGVRTTLVSRDMGGLARAFNQHSDWKLLYFDNNGFLFADAASLDAEFIKQNSILSLDLTRNLGFDPDVADASAAELENFISKYPESRLALGQLASIYRFQKNFAKAEETLFKIPKDKWDYVVYTEMGRLQAAQGKCKVAEGFYLEALKDRREQTFSRAVLDLAVLYGGCLGNKEKSEHFFNRYNTFVIDPSEREKVRQLSEEFGIKLSE